MKVPECNCVNESDVVSWARWIYVKLCSICNKFYSLSSASQCTAFDRRTQSYVTQQDLTNFTSHLMTYEMDNVVNNPLFHLTLTLGKYISVIRKAFAEKMRIALSVLC